MKHTRLSVVIGLPLLVVALSAVYPVPAILAQRDRAAALSGSAPITQAGPSPSAGCVVTGALEGVDVSAFQGVVTWSQVAQTKAFAYARAADGATYSDTTFLSNYAGIKSAGMKAGAYFFFRPAQDPTQQANLFVAKLTQAGFAPGDLVPMIDVDTTGGQVSTTVAARLQTAVNVIRDSLHVVPGINACLSCWNSDVGSTSFGADPLWIAFYNPSCPSVPVGWTDWTLWQYSSTSTTTVSGINGPVDLDRSHGPNLPLYVALRTFLPIIMDNVSTTNLHTAAATTVNSP